MFNVDLAALARCTRRLVLVSLDWTRDKDPRLPLALTSLMTALHDVRGVEVIPLPFAVNQPDFALAKTIDSIVDAASGRPQDQVDVAVGGYVWNEAHLRPLFAGLRQRGFTGRIILGGPQVSSCGPGLEALYPDVDVFVRGYGERPLRDLVLNLPIEDIPGAHLAGEQDLGRIAGVDARDLRSPYLSKVLPVIDGQVFLRWETQRGCPYRCSFCQHRGTVNHLKKGVIDRTRVLEEIRLFAANRVQDIAVLDPIFNLGPRAVEILEAFVREGFTGRLSVECRFERLTEDFLDVCQRLNMRLQFGLQTIHRAEGKAVRRINNMEKVEWGIKQLHQRKIPFEVSLIYGLPEQTLERFEETVAFCLERRVPVIKAFPLVLLRGTDLERERGRWELVESEEPIPRVIRSSTYNESDWSEMKLISGVLEQTEGHHPHDLAALRAIAREHRAFYRPASVPGLAAGTCDALRDMSGSVLPSSIL